MSPADRSSCRRPHHIVLTDGETPALQRRTNQSVVGSCALSTRIVLNAPLPGTTRKPHCSLIAVLSDGKGLPVYGKEGDIILGQFRLIRIGAESVELAYLDGRGRQTIRLSGS